MANCAIGKSALAAHLGGGNSGLGLALAAGAIPFPQRRFDAMRCDRRIGRPIYSPISSTFTNERLEMVERSVVVRTGPAAARLGKESGIAFGSPCVVFYV